MNDNPDNLSPATIEAIQQGCADSLAGRVVERDFSQYAQEPAQPIGTVISLTGRYQGSWLLINHRTNTPSDLMVKHFQDAAEATAKCEKLNLLLTDAVQSADYNRGCYEKSERAEGTLRSEIGKLQTELAAERLSMVAIETALKSAEAQLALLKSRKVFVPIDPPNGDLFVYHGCDIVALCRVAGVEVTR